MVCAAVLIESWLVVTPWLLVAPYLHHGCRLLIAPWLLVAPLAPSDQRVQSGESRGCLFRGSLIEQINAIDDREGYAI